MLVMHELMQAVRRGMRVLRLSGKKASVAGIETPQFADGAAAGLA